MNPPRVINRPTTSLTINHLRTRQPIAQRHTQNRAPKTRRIICQHKNPKAGQQKLLLQHLTYRLPRKRKRRLMRRPSQIEKDEIQITTVEDLTSVFESIASTQVAKVKGKVELSKQFFQLLWKRYTSLRIDPRTRITERDLGEGADKTAFIVISAEAGHSGDIDQLLVETMLQAYDPKTTDIIVLGTHGATQLRQRGIPYIKFFQVPETDRYIDVSPVINTVKSY